MTNTPENFDANVALFARCVQVYMEKAPFVLITRTPEGGITAAASSDADLIHLCGAVDPIVEAAKAQLSIAYPPELEFLGTPDQGGD